MKVRIGARAAPDFRPPFAPNARGARTFVKRITPCLQREKGIGRKAGSAAGFKDMCAGKAAVSRLNPISLRLPILMSYATLQKSGKTHSSKRGKIDMDACSGLSRGQACAMGSGDELPEPKALEALSASNIGHYS